ncbi:MAG: glycosyltransferase, partial [Coriobacteriales bacterium]|nr:glycosyltransferase [Coriobacteriales bacterium]
GPVWQALSGHKRSNTLAVELPPQARGSGAERVGNTIANGLAGDFEVHIVALYGPEASGSALPIDPRIKTTRLLLEEGRLRSMAKDIRKPLRAYLKQQGIDVLVCVGTYQSILALPAVAFTGVKTVNCDHGALVNSWDDRVISNMRRIAALFCDRTIVLTQRSYHDYQRLLHIPARKLQVIYNSISPEQIAAARPYDATSKRIIWAGRVVWDKGLDHLLDIAQRVLPAHPDWRWDVYGGGADLERLRACILERGLEDRLVLMGQVGDLPSRYGDYAFHTLTSPKEGLPLVLLEAKAAGIPNISFDCPTGPADIIRDGVDGVLVDCFDIESYSHRLEYLMDDVELRTRMAAASHDDLERFEQGPILLQWAELIRSL